MPTTTTTYSFNKPVVGGDEDAWGGYLNGNWDTVDDLLDGTTPVTGIDINSGAIDGTPIGAASASTGNFSTLSIGGTAITATATELNYVDGVTSNVQTQIDAKAAIDNPTFTTGITAPQVDVTAQGDLRLQDSTGGEYVALQAPATIGTSYTLTMPAADGAANQVLQTDGSGTLSFADAGGGMTTKISTTTVSTAAASVGITLPTSGYTYLILHFEGVLPDTNNVDFDFRLSDTSGANWEPIYWSKINIYSSSAAEQSSGYDCQFNYNGLSNAGDIEASGFVKIHIPTVTGVTSFQWSMRYNQATTNQNQGSLGYANLAGSGVTTNHCRFMMSSGNIASGVFTLYGVE